MLAPPWAITYFFNRTKKMTTLETVLLAVALAMDCFAVSITSGFILKKVRWRPILVMAFLFGLFQAMMPFIGWIGTKYFSSYIESFDHWIAFGLLAVIGGKMFVDGCKGGDEAHFDPTRLVTVLGLAVATSIDALAVGISFTCTGMTTFHSILFPLAAIGIVSSGFSLAGNMVGIFLGRRFHFPVEQTGGLILVAIGVKILLEHLL